MLSQKLPGKGALPDQEGRLEGTPRWPSIGPSVILRWSYDDRPNSNLDSEAIIDRVSPSPHHKGWIRASRPLSYIAALVTGGLRARRQPWKKSWRRKHHRWVVRTIDRFASERKTISSSCIGCLES